MQYSFADNELITLIDLEKRGLLEKTKFVIPTSQLIETPSQLIRMANTSEMYLYVETDEFGTLVPVLDVLKPEGFTVGYERNVKVGDRVFFNKYEVTNRSDGIEICFGNGI